MLHLKGDKNSSHAQLLQKALAKGKEARSSQNDTITDWQRAAQLNNNIQPINEQQATFLKAQQLRKDNDNNTEHKEQTSEDSNNNHNNNEYDSDNDDFDDIHKLRAKRMAALKRQSEVTQQLKQSGHGEYNEIFENNFLDHCTNTKHMICHFYHTSFERCKIIDKHLSILCKKYFTVKFVKINAEKTPFFTTKLNIKVLPTIVIFKDGIAIDRIVGFDELGGNDDFKTIVLEQRIAESKIIELKQDNNKPTGKTLEELKAERFQKGMKTTVISDDEEDWD